MRLRHRLIWSRDNGLTVFRLFSPTDAIFSFSQRHAGAFVGSLDGSAPKRLMLNSDSAAIYATPGVLLFMRQRTLMAQPFSVETLQTTGNPVQVAEVVAWAGASNTARCRCRRPQTARLHFMPLPAFKVEGCGWPGSTARARKSARLPASIPASYSTLSCRRAGTRIAVSRSPSGRLGEIDIWLIETARGISTRLTSDAATDQWPLWSPDEQQIVFASNRKGTFDLYAVPSNGSESEKLLLELPGTTTPTNWSSDGRFVLFNELSTDDRVRSVGTATRR